MTSKPSDTQEQPLEPKAAAPEATETDLNDEALDQVVASGAYPVPRLGNYNTGPTG